MASTSLSGFDGYESKTFTFKTSDGIDIKLDVLSPLVRHSSPTPIVVHYHGGFLVVGDRYSIPPYWLIQACVARKWIFVSPDYRLLPECTAHESVDDALDAYNWVADYLGTCLGIPLGPIVLAGSSAGAYLALTTAALAKRPPCAVVSLYGLLDLSNERYTTKGEGILGIPPMETAPILERFPHANEKGTIPLSGYPWPEDMKQDARFVFILTLHLEALVPDFATGIAGLSQEIAANGRDAIPESAQRLFVDAFDYTRGLPPVFLLHGKNDTGVPFILSESAAEKLKKAGTQVTTEFPVDAQHGFDVALGRIDIESVSSGDSNSPAVDSLKRAIEFLDKEVSRQ